MRSTYWTTCSYDAVSSGITFPVSSPVIEVLVFLLVGVSAVSTVLQPFDSLILLTSEFEVGSQLS